MHKTIASTILHSITEVLQLVIDDFDSAVVLFIGLVNAFSVIIDPIDIFNSLDKIFNVLITLFSLLILIRKYKKLKK